MKTKQIDNTRHLINPSGNDFATIKTSHHRWLNIVAPNGGRAESGVLVKNEVLQVGNIVNSKNGHWDNPSRGRVYSTQGISPTLCANAGGNHVPKMIIETDDYSFEIRKQTPREYLRLMDVDECYIDTLINAKTTTKAGKEKPLLSDSALYHLAGNSIVVNCMTLIFENLFYPNTEPKKGDQLKLF